MSVLANEIYDYLERTGNRSTKSWLKTKFHVGTPAINQALEALSGKLHNCIDGSGRVYFVPSKQQKEKAAPLAPSFVMKPYRQLDSLTERFREIEAQKVAFPSKFN